MTYRQTIFIESFESGALIVGNNPDKLFEASSGSVTVQSVTKRSGNYALRIYPSSAVAWVELEADGPTSGDNQGAFYIRFASLPSANCWLLTLVPSAGTGVYRGFAFNASTGYIRPGIHDVGPAPDVEEFGVDGTITVQTGVWYRIEFRITGPTSTTSKVEWTMVADGGGSGTAMTTFTSSTHSSKTGDSVMMFGDKWNSVSADYFIDDVYAVYSPGANWPTYPVDDDTRVIALRPSADGTHTNAGDFTDNDANSPPASVYDRLDDDPVTDSISGDHIYQDTIGTGSYLEMALENTPTDWPSGNYAIAASLLASVSSASVPAGRTFIRLRDTINNSDLIDNDPTIANANAKLWYRDNVAPYLGNQANNSKAMWDAILLRIGYADDVTPSVLVHDALVQIAYVMTPAITTKYGWGLLL